VAFSFSPDQTHLSKLIKVFMISRNLVGLKKLCRDSGSPGLSLGNPVLNGQMHILQMLIG